MRAVAANCRRSSEKLHGYSRNRHRENDCIIDKTARAARISPLSTLVRRYRPPRGAHTRWISCMRVSLPMTRGSGGFIKLLVASRVVNAMRRATAVRGEWRNNMRSRVIYEIRSRNVRSIKAVVSLQTGRVFLKICTREGVRSRRSFRRGRTRKNRDHSDQDNKNISTYSS